MQNSNGPAQTVTHASLIAKATCAKGNPCGTQNPPVSGEHSGKVSLSGVGLPALPPVPRLRSCRRLRPRRRLGEFRTARSFRLARRLDALRALAQGDALPAVSIEVGASV
jgi:hypothetical protein